MWATVKLVAWNPICRLTGWFHCRKTRRHCRQFGFTDSDLVSVMPTRPQRCQWKPNEFARRNLKMLEAGHCIHINKPNGDPEAVLFFLVSVCLSSTSMHWAQCFTKWWMDTEVQVPELVWIYKYQAGWLYPMEASTNTRLADYILWRHQQSDSQSRQ